MIEEQVSYIVAFLAGVLTYLSPCLLPLIPSFIVYITGISFKELQDTGTKKRGVRQKTIIHALLFIAGFSIVFVLLGLTATFIGKALFQFQKAIRIGGGILIALFGLSVTGLLRLDLLLKERRLGIKAKGANYLGSFIVGITFAAAWTPCAGPILGSILVLAGTKTSAYQGAGLLTAYSLGIAIPFFLTALAIGSFIGYLNKFRKIVGIVNIVSGIFLVIVGILVATNSIEVIAQKLLQGSTH